MYKMENISKASKILWYVIVFLFAFRDSMFAQNKHLSLGFKNSGLCFGNSKNYNGVRLNFWDTRTNRINGINLSLNSKMNISNGLSIGLFGSSDSICNGIKIGGLLAEARVMNGLLIGGLAAGGDQIKGIAIGASIGSGQMNGIGFSGFMVSDTMRGVFFQVFGIFSKEKQGNLSGFSLSIFMARMQTLNGCNISFVSEIENQNGISIGGINQAKNLYGVQIGLWNVAENKKRFKRLPLINFNFKKQALKPQP
jgi:hypothetical protein